MRSSNSLYALDSLESDSTLRTSRSLDTFEVTNSSVDPDALSSIVGENIVSLRACKFYVVKFIEFVSILDIDENRARRAMRTDDPANEDSVVRSLRLSG